MNTSDSIFIFGTCGGLLLLPVVAVLGVYLVGRRARQSFQQQIALEGASCTLKKNGDIEIEANFWRDLFLIVFFGAVLVGAALLLISAISLNSILLLLGVALVTVAPIVILGRSLLNPRYYFSVGTRQLEIWWGVSQRRIAFSDVSEYHITTSELQMSARPGNSTIHQATIEQKLKSGETTQLGTLSSLLGKPDLLDRCQAIGKLLSEATGASLMIDA